MAVATDKNTIVSTDLDGTLLDHYTYSWEPARESINWLKSKNIPVIINTSKTFGEVDSLQKACALDAPFIVENGSAIYFPKGNYKSNEIVAGNDDFDCCVLGCVRSEILSILRNLVDEHHYQFEGFSDWSVEKIIEHTGLSIESAQLASKREFSEPILWRDTDERFEAFSQHVLKAGLRIIRGGRFIHILGKADKGTAVTKLVDLFYGDEPCQVICLGDSYNDIDMLKIADIPVFVKSPVHDFPECDLSGWPGEKRAIYTQAFGPQGWREAMSQIFENKE